MYKFIYDSRYYKKKKKKKKKKVRIIKYQDLNVQL